MILIFESFTEHLHTVCYRIKSETMRKQSPIHGYSIHLTDFMGKPVNPLWILKKSNIPDTKQ